MSAESPRTVKSKKPSKFSTPTTPATPATPSAQVKRGLTSPDFPIDQRKNKPWLSPMSHTGEVVPMEGTTGGPLSDSDDSHSIYNITLREADIAQISMALKESFLILPGELHLGGPKPNCHNPGLGAPILYKLPLLPSGGKNISFSSGIQGFC